MRPDEAMALAHVTMSYLRRLDNAQSKSEIDAIVDEFMPWAKSRRVAPQIREHLATKAKALRSEMTARGGLSAATLWARTEVYGWDVERAITTPVRRKAE